MKGKIEKAVGGKAEDNLPRITKGMSDDERYEALKNCVMSLSARTDLEKQQFKYKTRSKRVFGQKILSMSLLRWRV